MTELRDFTTAAVILGRMNPLIFSPEWLLTNGVIGPDESAQAREHGIEVMAPNLTSIALGNMKLVVEEERMVLAVVDEPLVRAKDFIVNCFRALTHTPIVAVGLNFDAALHSKDREKWHRFGDILAPKEPWSEFLTDAGGQRIGGLRSLVVERGGPIFDRPGYIRFTVQIPEGDPSRAALQVNNHFQLGSNDAPLSGADAYKLLENVWDDAQRASHEMFLKVMAQADAA